ncbi:adenylyl-sulfate kinase [Pedobacter sp. SD-b]|uniref:Adenylyl-sulfate kinase n=1 Tax=Pedobacter segetis TaxID=2793069 RepID=A0ABS1BI22_9SPHI|nr:adenylyl-sulfate kinase [Pedobacter segetis]MBK0382514.1 adenylyl-sulfate kinase [Pedobacter segetis]
MVKVKAIWFFGLSASGKSTVSKKLFEDFTKNNIKCALLDADEIRNGLNKDLGFSIEGRQENIRRIAELCKLLISNNIIPIVSAITPLHIHRDLAIQIIGKDNLVFIYTKCPLIICQARDPKGLYKKAKAGEIKNFTGISDVFEEPNETIQFVETQSKAIEETFRDVQAILKKEFTKSNSNYSIAPYIKHQCLFVHIPKSGGISINRSLFCNLGTGHTPIWQFQKQLGEQAFNNFFKFTFVRNPWDRLVSAFLFLKKGGLNEADKLWSENNLKDYHDFESFVKNWVNEKNIFSYVHFIPQHYFLCVNGSKPLVDFIGKYENIEIDFKYVADKLNIKAPLQKLNVNETKNHYSNYYNEETISIVKDVYKRDIELFDYSFDYS